MCRPKFIGKLARAGAAMAVLSLGISNPVAAQDEDILNDRDGRIEILRAEQDIENGTMELIVALPASIGEVEPIASNFGVIEGRNSQDFIVQPVNDVVDVVVVVDTSGSMQGAPLQAATRAAASFIGQLPDEARIAVIGFGASPEVLTTFEDSRNASVAALNQLRSRGETALWDALSVAAETVQAGNGNEAYVVVLSDGGDTASVNDQAKAITALGNSGASLYAITLETAESDHSALEETAQSVTGTVLSTDNLDALEVLYAEVGDRLNNRYRIVFNTDRTDDRTIRVSVAVEGSIATASINIGDGNVAVAETGGVPNTLEGASQTEEASTLRTFTAVDRNGLFANSGLLIGSTAMFIGLLVIAVLIVDPFGYRVQTLGSMRAPEAGERVVSLGQRMTSAADRAIASHDEERGLDRTLDAAGINVKPGEFAVMAIALVAGTALVGSILTTRFLALALTLLVALSVMAYLNIKVSRRRKAFANQLHSTISILVGSMRAGRGLPQAIELVAEEAASPTSDEFRRVTIESRVGRDQIASLEAVADRMENEDLRWMAQAIQINRELGGDLTELLDNLAGVIRDRTRVKLQVRSLSAEGRMSAWVVGLLPVAMFIFMQIVNPDYISLLYTTFIGQLMFGGGLILMALGAVWMKNLVNVRY